MFKYEDLKVGDKVMVHSWGSLDSPDRIGTVTRITKMQIEIDDDFKFSNKNGQACGTKSDWFGTMICELTKEDKSRINKENSILRIKHLVSNCDFKQLSEYDLYEILKFFDKYFVYRQKN